MLYYWGKYCLKSLLMTWLVGQSVPSVRLQVIQNQEGGGWYMRGLCCHSGLETWTEKNLVKYSTKEDVMTCNRRRIILCTYTAWKAAMHSTSESLWTRSRASIVLLQ